MASCPSCSKKYAGFGGEDDRMPVILDCMCVICRGCALAEEARVQQQQPQKKGKGKGKGQAKMKEKYTPTPCMSCKTPCRTPVAQLRLDVATMKAVVGEKQQQEEVPLCAFCAEEHASKYCGDCVAQQRMLCHRCHTAMHHSAKKQGHTAVPIQEHLASAPAHAAGGGSAGAAAALLSNMCDTHIGHPLLLFCETCNMLICGMCAAFDHAGHIYKPIQEAIDAHRAMIEQAVADVKVTRNEAIAAASAIKIVRGQLKGNMEAALKVVEEGFNRVLRAVRQRRDELKALVTGAYNEKDDVYNKHITALEAIDTDSEAALQLVEATLASATPVELLERKQVFANGLARFTQHKVSLKAECASNMAIRLNQSFEDIADAVLAVGALDTGATDPAASTAAGDGLGAAKVGETAEFVVTAGEVGSGEQRNFGGDAVEIKLVAGGAELDEGVAPSGGGGGGAAAKPAGGKRKRGGSSGGKGRASKKSKTGGASSSAAAAARTIVRGAVTDNEDGTYGCSYTPAGPAVAVKSGVQQLEVLLNGKHIAGSPFAVEVRPSATITSWVFGSFQDGSYELSEGGAVIEKVINFGDAGAIADGAGCAPMTAGVHFWELEVVKDDAINGAWYFGVCRPGIDVNDGKNFRDRDDTWLMEQYNAPDWRLYCNTCAGTGLTLDPQPKMPDGSRIGLLLDLDNGGTLTMYLDNKSCGTIAAGLVGPLLPCIRSAWIGKVVKIHGGLAPPQ